jgi:GDPmannose 4,6-dehydratase
LLAGQLLAEGHEVLSASRTPSPLSAVRHLEVDVRDHDGLASLVAETKPEEIYYLAAHHASSEGVDRPFVGDLTESFAVNTAAFAALLAAVSTHAPSTRTLYASSCRVFGRGDGQRTNESTPRRPTCPYGISKAAAMSVAEHFRHVHGLFVTSAILFNHESELRGPTFIVTKLAQAALAASADPRTMVTVNSLDDATDWGAARDSVRAMRLMLRTGQPDDFVVATGTSHTVRELAAACFAVQGLDWSRHVIAQPVTARPPRSMAGDATKLQHKTGWSPSVTFDGLIRDILLRIQRHGSSRPTDFHSYL